MDPVRFGRTLGIGARLAAKTAARTAASAVDAALAPNPAAATSNPSGQHSRPSEARPKPRPSQPTSSYRSPSRPAPAAGRPSPAQPSTRRLVQAFTGPLRRLSGVLWLEFTGVFFGLFALTAAVGAWRLRFAWRPTPANATDHSHLLMAVAVGLLFSYFCSTSFLRARRRGRQP